VVVKELLRSVWHTAFSFLVEHHDGTLNSFLLACALTKFRTPRTSELHEFIEGAARVCHLDGLWS
jgi:hypothetical protein